MSIEFEPIKLGPEGKRSRRLEKWKHVRKTLLYMMGGIVASVLLNYFNNGAMNPHEIGNAAFWGAFMGLFISNSPCARGRC